MARKKPPKNKPPVRLPTGTTKSSNSSVKVATPDASSAVKSKVTDSPLAGSAAQTMSPPPAQNFSNRDLAKQTENPNPETLATDTQSVPGNKDQLGAASNSSEPPSQPAVGLQNPTDFWKGYVKESSVKLLPEQTPYTLDSGSSRTIPNSVVEKNKKAWEYFILGQFYEEPPARGAIHAIVNGIWSRQKRDITINKMEGNSFLFRVPCPNTRRRILAQSFWQIDDQTMFVAKWSPGIQQCKPELNMVPAWLEFTGVPLQFFNKDALKETAGLVGHPVCLHPATENLTNIENGDTRRIGVTSPWLPSLCSYCKKFGHTISRCKAAPPTCTICNSVRHVTAACPRSNHLPKDTAKQKGKAPIKNLLPIVGKQQIVYKQVGVKTMDQSEFVSSSVPKDPPPAASLPPAVIPSPSPIVPVSPRNGRVTVEYDLSERSFSVDLSTESHLKEQSSSGSLSDTTLSSEADDPADEDQFIKREKADSIMKSILPGWSVESNYEFSDLGKLWLIWKPSVQVNVIAKSLQMVTCTVKLPFHSTEIEVSFVYGSNCRKERRLLWDELESASSSSQLCGLPWIVLGDFNEIISPTEHSSADQFSSSRGMRDFRECLERSSLADLQFSGHNFTWTNHSVSKKLDRILCNEDWVEQFSDSIGVFGKPGISDHSPCCVFLDQLKPPQKRSFRFFAHLNDHPEFSALIKSTWNALPFYGSKQLCVSKKLKELKPIIRSFNKENFSNLEKRVDEAFSDLTNCQSASLSSPCPVTAESEKIARLKWLTLARAEDKFLKQRSRIQWNVEGDANTPFYHRVIKARQNQNHIHLLTDEHGNIIDSLEGIKQHAIDYYQSLLGGVNALTTSAPSEIAAVLQTKCSPSAVDALSAPFTDLDIQQAFLSLPKNKSPGPDGYPAEFFIGNWKSVGRDMIDAVQEFLSTGELLQQWNATILTLVPKKVNATKITEFRPISCCNTVYKVASKLLANRLKDLLPTLISSSQSAFVPGRLLVENVLLATELVSCYNWKKISKRCMLKIDLQKAFDTLDWDFILFTLEALDFPPSFRKLIEKCLTSTHFSVAINGESCGYFKGTRGLRQGDPLSPYLFVLALEVFSQLLIKKYVDGSVGFHPQTKDLQVKIIDISRLGFNLGSTWVHCQSAIWDFL
ncbi:hypothetical protein Bca101_096885 [Brassica carinata]